MTRRTFGTTSPLAVAVASAGETPDGGGLRAEHSAHEMVERIFHAVAGLGRRAHDGNARWSVGVEIRPLPGGPRAAARAARRRVPPAFGRSSLRWWPGISRRKSIRRSGAPDSSSRRTRRPAFTPFAARRSRCCLQGWGGSGSRRTKVMRRRTWREVQAPSAVSDNTCIAVAGTPRAARALRTRVPRKMRRAAW